MRIIITCSGGKDSVAALIWMRNHGYKNCDIVFCDTNWESDITYSYLEYLQQKTGTKFRFLKSDKFDGLIDLARKKKRFPSSQRRFCTSELKSIPMINYILDEVKDDFIVVQGIRGAESESRSKMLAQCNYFKYYLEPVETNATRLIKLENKLNALDSDGVGCQLNIFSDSEFEDSEEDNILKLKEQIEHLKDRLSKGKEDPKYHTYRRKEVLAYCKKFATDVLRPVFDWSAQTVIEYSLENGIDVNPLYSMGMKRVGCFPCIMSGLSEIHQIAIRCPERIAEIANYELEIKSSFFGPDKIPRKFYRGGIL
ncbi:MULTISPECIES: phosphoadenosine phosphosulfate reductase family protein [unclassified Dysgonomonas]|uniref:phosphoadenosine phosphosulfate reductase domain-containing protein n=1 Tax=unclassified Dysgonomonas TaxID=2630389 RepID=UPI0025BE6E54|nr:MULTISPECIES: phosphoadenosine phosphosulfate reductase family protein [unclassified Dysgonomonas]HMM02010.1 phosphoadenosine phosphosulfate reductase family protein [Dysgonomonas sp.]